MVSIVWTQCAPSRTHHLTRRLFINARSRPSLQVYFPVVGFYNSPVVCYKIIAWAIHIYPFYMIPGNMKLYTRLTHVLSYCTNWMRRATCSWIGSQVSPTLMYITNTWQITLTCINHYFSPFVLVIYCIALYRFLLYVATDDNSMW